MLTRAKSSKVIVYFSTSMSVKYHEDLLNHLDVECYAVHNYFEKRQDNLQVIFLSILIILLFVLNLILITKS